MKVLFLTIILSAFFASFSSAQPFYYGKKLKLDSAEDGRPVVSFLYDPFESAFYLINLRFPTSEIAHLQRRIYPVYLSFVNSESGEVLIPWIEVPQHPHEINSSQTSLELLDLQDKKIKEVVKSFNKVLMVLSFKKPIAEASADFYVSLGEICQSHPDLFRDLVDEKTLCQ